MALGLHRYKNQRLVQDYITDELPTLIEAHFNANDKRSICGHSMGGHGALICYLKKDGFYKSVSAFAPIASPTVVPWGINVFKNYLGSDENAWREWDSSILLSKATKSHDILIDQGANDEFLPNLQPHLLQDVAKSGKHNIAVNMREGYDHSYYFVATFLESHFAHHAQKLKTA